MVYPERGKRGEIGSIRETGDFGARAKHARRTMRLQRLNDDNVATLHADDAWPARSRVAQPLEFLERIARLKLNRAAKCAQSASDYSARSVGISAVTAATNRSSSDTGV